MKKSEAIATRTIPFVFSDESRDSYGTVIPVTSWDLSRFNRMGVALYNHSSYGNDPDNVIGSARAYIEGDKLLGEITFESGELNPKAEKVFQKLLVGTLKGCSVGFRMLEDGHWGEGEEARGGKNATYYFGRCELLEISVTPIPANRNARVRSMQGLDGAAPVVEGGDDGIYHYGLVCVFDAEEAEKSVGSVVTEGLSADRSVVARCRAIDMVASALLAMR